MCGVPRLVCVRSPLHPVQHVSHQCSVVAACISCFCRGWWLVVRSDVIGLAVLVMV